MKRKVFEELLNKRGVPELDKRCNGGLYDDNCKYGTQLRRNDLNKFNQLYFEEIKKTS